MKRLLIQTQLSNYNTKGEFTLECDSGWQMTMGRVREMLKLVPDLHIDVMGPYIDLCDQYQLVTPPHIVNPDLFIDYADRLRYIEHWIVPNALATRYDFDYESISNALKLHQHKEYSNKRYDAVLINDPMHLRNFKALFYLKGGYTPKFFVHSHFVDDPSCPKFPTEASLWLGQMEAAIKADWNFWQCQSTLDIVKQEMSKFYLPHVVDAVMAKSTPWDDGYSQTEMTNLENLNKVRFDIKDVMRMKFSEKKIIIFVPNRIGGKGRSSDYTNCGKFMFEILPELRKRRQDFVVIAGNPSQKIFNHELEKECGQNGYISLVPDTFNRDEFKIIASFSDIAVGLYDQDSYGGTAARECIEMGCVPLWIDKYEYSTLAKLANWPYIASDLGNNLVLMADALIETVKNKKHAEWIPKLQQVVRERCSYEATTPAMLKLMGLLQ